MPIRWVEHRGMGGVPCDSVWDDAGPVVGVAENIAGEVQGCVLPNGVDEVLFNQRWVSFRVSRLVRQR